MKKILVTGGAGFIGSHLLPYLIDKNYEVTVLDDLSSGKREHVPAEIDFIQMNICSEDVAEVMAIKKFDAVINLAGQVSVPVSIKRPLFDERTNIEGTLNILINAHKNGVKRIIFSSTAAVYGNNNNLPLSEEEIPAPLSFYGLSKFTAEQYIKMFHKQFDLDYVILRFANVYGERQDNIGESGVISIFARQIAQGKEISVFGNGNQTRDFVYAGDIAAGLERALVTKAKNNIYNLSTNTQISLNELIVMIGDIAKKKVSVSYLSERSGDIYNSALDNKMAINQLLWHANTSLKDGLKRTYNYFK